MMSTLGLKTVRQSLTTVTVTAPSNDRYGPRGVYMLWVIANNGAVSDAIWVVLR